VHRCRTARKRGPQRPQEPDAGIADAAVGWANDARRWMAALDAQRRSMPAAERGLSWGEATYWRSAIAAQLRDSTAALALFRQARDEGLGMEPSVHAEPAFSALGDWAPWTALMSPVVGSEPRPRRPATAR
jgi:hypothetical protein